MMPAAAILKRWRENPAAFVLENFQVAPDAWQLDVLNAFPSNDPSMRRISMQACAGPGKSAVLAWLGWNFLACYGERGEHPKGAAVSITKENLRDNLWSEFAKWQERSDFLRSAFVWQKERIFARDHPATWFLSARAFSKKADPEQQARTLSGLHSKFVLCLFDESGDIPVPVMRAGEQAMGNTAFGKLCQAGNPTSHDGMLYAAAVTQRHLWFVVSVTGDPDDPKRSPRVDIEWAREQIRLYSKENPWVKAYILGQFPPASINQILSLEDVEAAMARHLREDEYDWAQKRLGVDVARFGDDRSTICPRMGLVWFKPVIMRQARTTEIAARVAMAKERWGAEVIIVDDTGHWGHGVIDNLITARIPAIGIQYHAPALDPRYYNRRAEMWMTGADAIKAGAALPHLPELVAELTTPTYTFLQGKFLVEPKDLVKKRLGRSPDIADGYFNTYALPDMPRGMAHKLGIPGSGRAAADFDPYAGLEQRQESAKSDWNPFAEVI